MAILDELVQKITDPDLRSRIAAEVERLAKQKKFGLVFEEHLPECTPLWDIPVKKGAKVARKAGPVSDFYTVLKIEDEKATCLKPDKSETKEFAVDELVTVAEFGEPIYPFLKPIDTICNAPDSDLWHTLIEADNYHALQLLEYLYAGKVDCIYIDPPYNSGATDWKYNNNYVDKNDAYRHSKWLSFMKKRLLLAKKLLNPKDSVLIVTIDEKEYLHLGCLLEKLFPEARMQMVSSVINPHGANRKNMFARVEEYIYYVFLGDAKVAWFSYDMLNLVENTERDTWARLLRGGTSGLRVSTPNQCYPIFFDESNGNYYGIGDVIPADLHFSDIIPPKGCFACFPKGRDGKERCWGLTPASFLAKKSKGYIKFGPYEPGKHYRAIYHLQSGTIKAIENGDLRVYGTNQDGTLLVDDLDTPKRPVSMWVQRLHDSRVHGAMHLNSFFPEIRFQYPKSIYAVRDAINFCVADKPNAIILDFFAGSGTTLHAVNMLNAEDCGHRRCILVTNNEMTSDEAGALKNQGILPGTDGYNARGIARYVTWPRTTCSIKGVNINGEPLSGEYITSQTEVKESKRTITQLSFVSDPAQLNPPQKKQIVSLISRKGKLPQNLVDKDCPFIVSEEHNISVLFDDSRLDDYLDALEGQEHIREIFIVTSDNKLFRTAKEQINELLGTYKETVPVKRPMSEGFKANAIFFQLGFLDKNAVALGRQFKEMLPTLWMKAGAVGPCPSIGEETPDMLILPENHFAVLVNEQNYMEFAEELEQYPEIETVFIVTDSESGYRDMIAGLEAKESYQLYRDYPDNFRINSVRR